MQFGGESNLGLLMIFVVGGVLVGALLMFLIMNAFRSQKDAGEAVHTQPLPKKEANGEDGLIGGRMQEMQAPIAPVDLSVKNTKTSINSTLEEKNSNLVEASPYPDLQNEFSFWRSKDGKQVLVKMGETWHETTQSMDKEQLDRFKAVTKIIASWQGQNGMPEKLIPQPAEKETETVQKTTINKPAPPVSLDVPKRKMSIVEQVDEILQEILREQNMQNVNVRLTEMMNRGLVVWVGKEFYEGIDAVPDPQVKIYIREAVKRWESLDNSI